MRHSPSRSAGLPATTGLRPSWSRRPRGANRAASCTALAESFREDFLPRWLEVPYEGRGGLKPVESSRRCAADRLWRVVLLIDSEMPT